ncbi:MAG TPA: UDP-N-acetylglucosamine--N-acetylmuramyl-(pentapeptide) pyrophosphoryl-undecaprenol N-acetylglucosamine transferase [Tepidisphaeraceae bacterium]|jgi:UDP-N-acetylglucosamine--N-acetylmuramyl-(pentapeptide) pyrophosphoryl-undecaprenol N-acetylglucosamine transferase
MTDRPTILFAGGGTGGHLYPGVSVAQALAARWPNARPLFLCTTRAIDETILTPTGFDYEKQPILPPVKSVGGLLSFWKSWRETKDLLKRVLNDHKPVAVLGLGGYAAGPAVKFCAEKGMPAAILNPDVLPGKANQFLFKYAKRVCCGFDATREHVPAAHHDKLVVTGCPVRDDLIRLPPRAEAAKRLGLDPKLSTLTVTGASQGAQTVNEAVIESLRTSKLQGWQVLHLAGRDHAAAVRTAYRDAGLAAVVIDFTPAMADVWAVTDLAVARSGASTCAELTACGLASVLMPYPFHKDMHQRANAKVLADAGAAVLLDDEKDRRRNSERLRPVLQSLLYDAPKRQAMAAAAKAMGRPDASAAVAAYVAGLAGLPGD